MAAKLPVPVGMSDALIREIAMDIGNDTVAYIEVMYPEAVAAASSTFRLSVRNYIYNQIMAAVQINDESEIASRLRQRKTDRRRWVKQYRDLRKKD
mgnify:CR=1 FL=1